MAGPAESFDGVFRQTAWVTNDVDAAIALFARDYGAPHWLQIRDFSLQTGPEDFAKAHMALARRGGMELELIQPLGGADHVYAQMLSGETHALQICFHHVCYGFATPEGLEGARRSALASGRRIVLSARKDTGMAYFYTDDRATLGHHTEFIYCPKDRLDWLNANIPVN